MQHAGINLGYGHTKLKLENAELTFASIVAVSADDFAGLGFDRKNRKTRFQGKTYEVGTGAGQLEWTAGGGKEVYPKWGGSPTYRVLQQAVIDAMADASTGEEPWRIVTGVAVDHYRDKAYVAQLTGMWTGLHASSSGKPVEIVGARVVPEPVGAYWYVLLSNPEVKRIAELGRVTVVDVGYYTTDWVTVDRMALIDGESSGVNRGMYVFYQDLQGRIRDHTGNTYNLSEIEQAFLGDRTLLDKRDTLDIAEWRKSVIDTNGPRVVSALRSSLGEAQASGRLYILAGGGADIIRPFLTDLGLGSEVQVAEDPQMANARGYWMMARRWTESVDAGKGGQSTAHDKTAR